jgi:hypothetical protein
MTSVSERDAYPEVRRVQYDIVRNFQATPLYATLRRPGRQPGVEGSVSLFVIEPYGCIPIHGKFNPDLWEFSRQPPAWIGTWEEVGILWRH